MILAKSIAPLKLVQKNFAMTSAVVSARTGSVAALSVTHLLNKKPPGICLSNSSGRFIGSARPGIVRYSLALNIVRAASLEQKYDINILANQGSKEPIDAWKIKMLYDGECPLCMREVNMLRERNKRYRTIKFVDISSDDYSSEENAGLDYKTVMGRIHAILYDGTVLTDIAAFKRLYEEVGLGWVYGITKYEPIATIVNAIYAVWAKYRLAITGRPNLEQVLDERERKRVKACNEEGRCQM